MPAVEVPERSGTLSVGVTSEANGWDPSLAGWQVQQQIVGSTFLEPLFVDDRDGNTFPWLAESGTPNADATSWVIRLRADIAFQDGSALDGAALKKDLDHKLTGLVTSLILKPRVSAVALDPADPLTVRVMLTRPDWSFLHYLALFPGLVLAPASIDAGPEVSSRQPIGTGPYRVETWTPNVILRAKANDRYWGGPCARAERAGDLQRFCDQIDLANGARNGPFFDAVEFFPIIDAGQVNAKLLAGELDMALTDSAEQLARQPDRFTVLRDFASERTLVNLNTSAPPFNDVHARRALALATDPTEVAAVIAHGQPVASTTSAFSSATRWALPDAQSDYADNDLEAAKREVAEYRSTAKADALRFTVMGLDGSEQLLMLQTLRKQWARAGIDAQAEGAPLDKLSPKLVLGLFQSMVFDNYSYSDPGLNDVVWSSPTDPSVPFTLNVTRFGSATIDANLAEARSLTDFEQRRNRYHAIARERNRAVTEIWLFDKLHAMVASRNIRGLDRFEQVPFGTSMAKPWIGGIWRSSDSSR